MCNRDYTSSDLNAQGQMTRKDPKGFGKPLGSALRPCAGRESASLRPVPVQARRGVVRSFRQWPGGATASPTPPPEPWTLAGSGDSIAALGHPCLPAVAHITGNASSAYFSVTNLDANNESIDLLVNTVDPYDGYRPFDWADGACTTRFEVKASGDWTIEILPLPHLAADPGWWLTIPGTREGAGDAVFLLDGTPDTAQISGNAGGNYFGVIGWGTRSALLVNTVDPYDGTVLLDKRTFAIEVRASGPWTLAVK